MKYTVAITLLLLLVGCSTPKVATIKTEVQYVDKPIFICPAPPLVPTTQLLVDNLTDDDINDPGKVGQAYKHDMLYLRQTNEILRKIIEQYAATSTNFEQVRAEIDKLSAPTPKTPSPQ